MYSREYTKSTGAVKAFEDAYAKEEFLRRSGASDRNEKNSSNSLSCDRAEGTCGNNYASESVENIHMSTNNYAAKRTRGLAGLFSEKDSGDMLLLLLIVFFLLDSDKENDFIIPVLLAVLLLF